MWVLIGLIVSFLTIIFLVRKKENFGLSMLLAAGILAIFSQVNLSFQETLLVLEEAVTSIDTLALIIDVVLIGILANAMKETGEISEIIENTRARFPRGGVLASTPAVFGLLPVPGGALMSAPLVDEEGERINVSNSARVFLNLWFRHIGFLIFPLAPPLLLLAHEANVELHWLILIQVPIFLMALMVGVFVLRREVRKTKQPSEKEVKESDTSGSLLRNITPILIPVVLFFLFSYFTGLSFYLSLLVSLPVGILVSLRLGQVSIKKSIKTIREGTSIDLASAVFGIMIFYKVVQSSGLAESLSNIFLGSILPIPLIIILIGFILGFSMGHNLGAVGVTYSILAPTISGHLPWISLVYISSFLGYLISPIHLCVAVSIEYFKPNTKNLYKTYAPASLTILTASTILLTLL